MPITDADLYPSPRFKKRCLKQGARIGRLGRGKQGFGVPFFHYLPMAHNDHPMGHSAYDREIVGNE